MYRFFIALRYLRHKRINFLAMLGVAVGVMVLFIVHSVMTGFSQEMRARIRGNLSDLIVEREGKEPVSGYEEAMARIEAMEHVEAVSPRLEGLALVKVGSREQYGWAQFSGIDLAKECRTTKLTDYWRAAQKGEADASATPTWGKIEKEGVSPAIVGAELVVIGRDLEGRIHSLGVGDRIVLITAPSALDRAVLPCVIAGKFKSGMYEYDDKNVYIPLDEAQKLLERPGKVTAIAVRLDDYANAEQVRAAILGVPTLDELMRFRKLLRSAGEPVEPSELPREDLAQELRKNYYEWRDTGNPLYVGMSLAVARGYMQMADAMASAGSLKDPQRHSELLRLRDELASRSANALGPDYRVSTWEDKQRPVLRAIGIERKVTVIIQSFLFLLAWVLIYSILSSSVVEKTKDIGILKSLGCTRGGIMTIFLFNGFVIGFVGSVVGTLGGVFFCRNINTVADWVYKLTRLRVFPPDIYYLDKIPVDRNPTDWIIIVGGVAIIVSLLAALKPAYRAARLNPVEALRYE